MARFCRKCGAALTEGSRFCRQCGTPTGTFSATPPQVSPTPTASLDKTEPMTNILSPTGDVASAQSEGATAKLGASKKGQSVKLIGGTLLLVLIGVGAFYIGSQWNKPQHQDQGGIASPANPDASQPTPSAQSGISTPDTAPMAQPPFSPPATSDQPVEPTTKLRERPTAMSQPAHPPEKRRANTPPASTESVGGATTKSVLSAKEYYDQGIQDLNSGRYDAALEKFEHVRRMSPENKDVYYLIGQAHHKSKRLAEALRAYEQCTSGPYASLAQQHVKALSKQLKKKSN